VIHKILLSQNFTSKETAELTK